MKTFYLCRCINCLQIYNYKAEDKKTFNWRTALIKAVATEPKGVVVKITTGVCPNCLIAYTGGEK
ncbi:MAG: hypothetical protein DRG27_06950 [Deltaproteobacteria bacterium]|nr:MAG: hypothetical protein DRG27_06950 [Deltaproteobacteria bacterium]